VTATKQRVRIAYDDVGGGDPAVVLMHGLFEDRSYYAAQVRHLSTRHRVLNIDLRGHGESDVPEAGYTLDSLADDVVRVLDGSDVKRAVLCSHSMALALRVATRRPDLAAGVVLLDGALLIVPPALEGLTRMVEALDGDGWRDALLGFFTSVAGAAEPRVRADIAAAPRFYAAPILHEIIACNSTVHPQELAALECPLLYVHGDMPLDLDRLRAAQPDAIVEEIPDAGHYVMLTAPDRLNALLDRFLEVIR
jgi:pimeloyl-ACP methyl ester carboxylesterase